MMMSLFSVFDPIALMNIQSNWMIMIFSLMIIPMNFWINKSRTMTTFFLIKKFLHNELKMIFTSKMLMKGTTLIPITLFYFIMSNNILSNFPYTFCCSAHLIFSMTLALPVWLAIILYSWMNLTKSMLAHLVPLGTPTPLMPLMVMIELISNFIRPMALAIRLTANLIAGHLLMTLLGNSMNILKPLWFIVLLVQIMFLLFELMVALIQSYVFSVLMTLYSSEVN